MSSEFLLKQNQELREQRAGLTAEVEKLRKALEFYARDEMYTFEQDWEDDTWMDPNPEQSGYFPPRPPKELVEEYMAFRADNGAVAKAALAKK